MPNIVKLGGIGVDIDDPCALYQALYIAKLKMTMGEMVGEFSVQSPVTRESVMFSPGNLKALDAEMARLQTACDRKTTGAKSSRRRRMTY